jgi:hypothetical protein
MKSQTSIPIVFEWLVCLKTRATAKSASKNVRVNEPFVAVPTESGK